MQRLVKHRLVIGAVMILASACAPATSTTPSLSPVQGTAPTTAAPARPPLVIGLVLPFTESAIHSEIGIAQRRAAELYVSQHGGMLGGRRVTFAYSDESIDGAQDAVKATELIDKNHAEVLLGLIGSDGAYAVRDVADHRKVVFIDTSASGNALTRAVPDCKPSCKSAVVFRSSFSTWQLAEPLGDWAAQHGHQRFFVAYPDDPIGSESAAAFTEGLAKAGGAATGRAGVPANADWGRVMDAIRAQPTKDVFAAFSGSDAIGFIGAWSRARLNAAGYRLFGPGFLTESDVLATVKSQADGITTASFWSSALDNPQSRALLQLFARTYHDDQGNPVPADAYAVEMWDAMTALDLALWGTAGSASSDALIPALAKVSFTGARGPFAFDPVTHNVVQAIYVRTVRSSAGSQSNAIVDTIRAVTDPGGCPEVC